jgi:hypothetical protein
MMATETKPKVAKKNDLRCKVCGAVLINVTSGAVCPDAFGHGKLMPKCDERDLRLERLVDWSASLPEATSYESNDSLNRKIKRWRVGNIGNLTRVRRLKRIPDAQDREGGIFATVAGLTYEFYRG